MNHEAPVAIVTGSTSGIGLGIAEALAAEGMGLMLNGFGDPDEIEFTRARIQDEYGVQVRYNGADLSKVSDVRALVDAATHEMGRVDVLVNNAAIQFTAPVHEFPADRWDAIIAVNLSATFHAIAAALPQMLERNWGRIVNVACVHGLVASTQKVAWVAAKHGVVGLTKVVALETAHTGITCNAICPGWVLTPVVQKQIDELARGDKISARVAQGRLLRDKQPSMEFASAGQIGALTAFLCSEDASQIRGVALPVDGGWVSQ